MTPPRDQKPPAGEGVADPAPSMPRSESSSVLIVEDDRRLCEMLRVAVSEMGLEATTAHSAEAALRIIGESHFAIALVDLNLPGKGGLDFCQLLYDQKSGTQMIILTGFADLAAAQRAIRLEAVDFLTKPCGMDELESALARARERWIDRWFGAQRSGGTLSSARPFQLPRVEATPTTAATSMEAMERQHILATLARHNGNRESAAAELGISVRKLYYRLRQYQRQQTTDDRQHVHDSRRPD